MCTNTPTLSFSSSSSLCGDSLLLSCSGKFQKLKLRSTPGGLAGAIDEPEPRLRVSHPRAGGRTGFQVSCSNPCTVICVVFSNARSEFDFSGCKKWAAKFESSPSLPLVVASSYSRYSSSISMNFFFFVWSICLFVSGVLGILWLQICNIIELGEYKMGDFWGSSDLFSSLNFFLIICKSFVFGVVCRSHPCECVTSRTRRGNFFKSGTKGWNDNILLVRGQRSRPLWHHFVLFLWIGLLRNASNLIHLDSNMNWLECL